MEVSRVTRLLPCALVLGACASTTSGQLRTAPPEVERVVEDPGTQKLATQALDDIALGRGEVQKRLAVPFVIGPGMWGEMLQLDPKLESIGTPSTAVVPTGQGNREWKMGGFMHEDEVNKIAHHIKLRALAEAFRGGQVRPATSQERKLFYALTPLEIAGKPLTVFVIQPDHRLAVYIEGGRLAWIDLLSAYTATLK